MLTVQLISQPLFWSYKLSGYIGSKRGVSHQTVTLPFVASNGNTIIHADGTLDGVDFAPVEAQISSVQNQINSIEEDITSLDTSVALLEDAVENISIDILTHKSTLDENYVVEEGQSALLMGPVQLPGTLDVSANAALTVFGEISIDGSLDISGTFSVR